MARNTETAPNASRCRLVADVRLSITYWVCSAVGFGSFVGPRVSQHLRGGKIVPLKQEAVIPLRGIPFDRALKQARVLLDPFEIGLDCPLRVFVATARSHPHR
jgi:hypothetical protein